VRLSRRATLDVSLLVLVNAMWAAQYSAYKVASEKMGPVTISAWTILFASLVLLPFLARERRRGNLQPMSDEPLSGSHEISNRSLFNQRNAVGFLMIGVLGLIPASAFLAS
jgi:drug/metabolite transporter (DMT)-like permease